MTAADIIGVGGPVGAVALAFGYFLSYLIKRRSSESGVVETTKATLNIVREQQQEMADALRSLRSENHDLRERLRLKDDQYDKLEDRSQDLSEHVERLERENAELRRRLDAIENWGGSVPPPPPLSDSPPFSRPTRWTKPDDDQ